MFPAESPGSPEAGVSIVCLECDRVSLRTHKRVSLLWLFSVFPLKAGNVVLFSTESKALKVALPPSCCFLSPRTGWKLPSDGGEQRCHSLLGSSAVANICLSVRLTSPSIRSWRAWECEEPWGSINHSETRTLPAGCRYRQRTERKFGLRRINTQCKLTTTANTNKLNPS